MYIDDTELDQVSIMHLCPADDTHHVFAELDARREKKKIILILLPKEKQCSAFRSPWDFHDLKRRNRHLNLHICFFTSKPGVARLAACTHFPVYDSQEAFIQASFGKTQRSPHTALPSTDRMEKTERDTALLIQPSTDAPVHTGANQKRSPGMYVNHPRVPEAPDAPSIEDSSQVPSPLSNDTLFVPDTTDLHQSLPDTPTAKHLSLPDTERRNGTLLPSSSSTQGRQAYRSLIALLAVLTVATAWLLPVLFAPTQAQPRVVLPPTVGTVAFLNSGQGNRDLTQGYNDSIAIHFYNLPPPSPHMSLSIWLMPDTSNSSTPAILLGKLHAGQNTFTYTSPQHKNLLATYSGVRVIEQPGDRVPSPPSAHWRWEGWLSPIPTRQNKKDASFLSHLRQLLAADPTLRVNNLPGGLSLWLTRNSAKIEEWASAAQGQWHGEQTTDADAALIHRHLLRILEYLDGQAYYMRDVPPGSAWIVDPVAGRIGLLNSAKNQNPPAYVENVEANVEKLMMSSGYTKTQQPFARVATTAIHRMLFDLEQVHKDAMELVNVKTDQLRQPGNLALLNEMANLTTEVKSGWFDPQTGENVGGVLWLAASLQQLATVPIR